MDLSTDIVVAAITQVGTLLAAIGVGVLTFFTNRRVSRVEKTTKATSEDVSVVRAETRNAHNPDQPMRHDIDLLLKNQADDKKVREDYRAEQREVSAKILARLDGHDREFASIRNDGTHQWDSINLALSTANKASADISAAVRSLSQATSAITVQRRNSHG